MPHLYRSGLTPFHIGTGTGLTYDEPGRRPAGGVPRHHAVLGCGRGRRHFSTCACASVGRALGAWASYLGCHNMKGGFPFLASLLKMASCVLSESHVSNVMSTLPTPCVIQSAAHRVLTRRAHGTAFLRLPRREPQRQGRWWWQQPLWLRIERCMPCTVYHVG